MNEMHPRVRPSKGEREGRREHRDTNKEQEGQGGVYDLEGGENGRRRKERTGEDWVTQREKSSVTSIRAAFHREGSVTIQHHWIEVVFLCDSSGQMIFSSITRCQHGNSVSQFGIDLCCPAKHAGFISDNRPSVKIVHLLLLFSVVGYTVYYAETP
ncbi:hypothetical protein INR49_032231 [Caranx melampygus]|nr:hypothetical protein INR49_032231 [Caranx melampygus]